MDPINFTYDNFDYGILPRVTISKCNFISNKELSEFYFESGHAIELFYDHFTETDLIITNNCQFIDNCNINNIGCVIYVLYMKEFLFENSTMLFTDQNLSTCGINFAFLSNINIRSSNFSNNGKYIESVYVGYGYINIYISNDTIITNCIFYSSTSNEGSIAFHGYFVNPINFIFLLENCFFYDCVGCCFYQYQGQANVIGMIHNCTFDNCSCHVRDNGYRNKYK